MMKLRLNGDAAQQRKGSARFAIFVGGLWDSGKNEFIDNAMKTFDAGQFCHRPLNDETGVHCSDVFPLGDFEAYCLRLPCLCLCDQFLIQSRILAKIADQIKNMEDDEEVSSFVYLVNDSQSEADVKRHRLHLESWSNIFGKPSELEVPSFLVASSLLNALPPDIRVLCSSWKYNISGTEVTNLMPHKEAEESVRQAISSCSQMTVQLRAELKEPRPLRKTTVGRHYVKILKKRRKELHGHWWQVLRRREDPDGALKKLNTELDHWKKCKLPRDCKDCHFT